MTSPISPVTDPSQGSTANTSSLGTAGLLDPSTFLSLLVDELKYQNPLDPTSSSDFMSQIAQLSQVEQLQSVSSASQMDEAAGLIGKTVSANDAVRGNDLRRGDRRDQWQLGAAAQRGQRHGLPLGRAADQRRRLFELTWLRTVSRPRPCPDPNDQDHRYPD